MITAIRPGAPRFSEPDEPRFKPCKGELRKEEFAVEVPECGLDEVICEADVRWRRHRDGSFSWYVADVYNGDVVFRFATRGIFEPANPDEFLHRLFGAKLAERIEREHASWIEERCAEEAER